MFRDETVSPSAFAWLLIGTTALLTAVWMASAGLSLAWSSAGSLCAACLGLEALALFYRTKRVEPRIAATLSGLSQLLVFSAIGGLLSYAAGRTGGALWDDRLQAIDRSLGLDWCAYLAFMDAHPTLSGVLTLAYRSLMAQTCLIVMVLGLTGRTRALRAYITAFILAALTSIIFAALMPAMGTYVHFGLKAADFAHLQPAAPFDHVADLTGLRDGTLVRLSLDRMQGIITFPSVHAAMGVLFGYYFWTVRALRIPLGLLNAMLIAGTPIDGGHYFTDVLGGIVIAVAAIAVSGAVHRHPARTTTSAPAPVRGAVALGTGLQAPAG